MAVIVDRGHDGLVIDALAVGADARTTLNRVANDLATDDLRLAHVESSSGANGYAATTAWSYATTRMGMPIRSRSGSLSASRPSTRR